MPESLLLPGNFILDVAVESEDGFPYDYYRYAAKFQMVCQENEEGLVHLPHTWAARWDRATITDLHGYVYRKTMVNW